MITRCILFSTLTAEWEGMREGTSKLSPDLINYTAPDPPSPFLNPWIRHCKLCLHINLVLRDSAEVFYEAVNANSEWKMILFKTTRKIGFVCEMGESSVYYVR